MGNKIKLTKELIDKIMEDPDFPARVDRYQVQMLAEYGHTDEYMAGFFGVTLDIWEGWKRRFPEFYQVLQFWKNFADEEVERALFEKARGYSVEEEKIFCNADGLVTRARVTKHYPPDVKAAAKWLDNRKPDAWQEKSHVEISGDKDLADMIIKARGRARKNTEDEGDDIL